jgi:peptidoglycan hydrolase CwlO-like protein
MKKLTLVALCLLMLGSCQEQKTTKPDPLQELRDSFNEVVSQKDAELSDIMNTLSDIQDGFRLIDETQGKLAVANANPESMSPQDVRQHIESINNTLRLNKERIAHLEQQLKSSSIASAKLRGTIEEMNRQLTEKTQQIAQLEEQLRTKDIKIAEQTEQITTLSQDKEELTKENEQKAQTVARQDKELNTAWYVFGTKRELKEQHILENGDVMKTNNFNKDYFTKIDIRVVTSVKLYSKSAQLLTSHPAGSYTLDRDAQKQYTLHITDPQKFWSVSRYLVIQVK